MDKGHVRIAITGATGFLGGHLVRAFADGGATVRGVVRTVPSSTSLPVADWASADLLDRDALTRAFAGMDVVVSNAAVYTIRAQSWEAFTVPNIQGTENVLRAAHAAGVRRVVHVSSTAVYRRSVGRTNHEGSEQLTMADKGKARPYAVSKALSEQLAWRVAGELGLELTCLRPCAIYGSGDRQFLPTMARYMRSPILPLPTARMPLVHGADVALAAVAAWQRPESIGRSYNLAGEPIAFTELGRAWKRASGKGPVVIPVPLPVSVIYDTSAARRDLGFAPRSLSEGLAEAFAGGFSDHAW
jgi:nucleoside-diphosphate-sugar epimerase